MAIAKFKTWKPYEVAFELARQIFQVTVDFPKEERYSLTDQIRRSSRSVCANLAESFAKRIYPKHFKSKLTDCIGENLETQVWLDFALASHYMDEATHELLHAKSVSVNKLLYYMLSNPEKY